MTGRGRFTDVSHGGNVVLGWINDATPLDWQPDNFIGLRTDGADVYLRACANGDRSSGETPLMFDLGTGDSFSFTLDYDPEGNGGDGTPLPGGWVSFCPKDAEKKVAARGQILPDGTFELTTYERGDGAVEGRHQAPVVPLIRVDRGDLAAGMRAPPPPSPPVDRRFSNFETSELEFTVTNDSQQNRFEIVVSRQTSNRR